MNSLSIWIEVLGLVMVVGVRGGWVAHATVERHWRVPAMHARQRLQRVRAAALWVPSTSGL
jgi:hypothetical protein